MSQPSEAKTTGVPNTHQIFPSDVNPCTTMESALCTGSPHQTLATVP